MSPQNKQFITWMIAIPLIAAFVGFVLVNEAPVTRSTPTASAPTTTRGGRGVPAANRPAVSQPTNQPPSQPSGGRGRAAQPTAVMNASDFFQLLDKKPESIASVTFLNGSDRVHVTKKEDATRYIVTLPDDGRPEAIRMAIAKQVPWKTEADSTASLRGFFYAFGPIILIVLIILFLSNRSAAGAGGRLANFGRSRGTSAEDENAKLRKVTFNDVAGCDEAAKELKRIAKALRWRKLYRFFGAKIPRGVILQGPPGTGKTLLARAVAGEVDGTFEATSGSDFVEMFVGVGASRVRDMFEKGRQKVKKTGKPHIIFIDEIDAVGGKRGGGTSASGNSEREQTLNAILVEMDGMKDNEGLVVIAATNRVDILDDALLRPGRFDVQVSVDLPNKEGRAKIFAIHTRRKPLAQGIDGEMLAARTYGYSGAEIEGACNRAALLAAERYAGTFPEDADDAAIDAALKAAGGVIQLADFDEGIDFVRYGAADRSRQTAMSDATKVNTTVHEGGHAIASDVMPGSDPVVKITILNRSRALGYVQNMPADDRYGMDYEQLVARIVTMMAGRAAQEVLLGKRDTGASNDFEQACRLAHNMVTVWGMSSLGHLSVGNGPGTGMRGMGSGPISNYGPKLADQIDDEWRRIVEKCYAIARYIIETDRERLEKLVELLKAKETVLGDEWIAFTAANPSKVDPAKLVLDLTIQERSAQ